MQYRVVEKSRLSSGASTPHHNSMRRADGNDLRANLPPHVERDRSPTPRNDITPNRTVKERLGVASNGKENITSGSRDRRPVLERLSEPSYGRDQTTRRSPIFESGRLQLMDEATTEEEQAENGEAVTLAPEEDRLPATLRLEIRQQEERSYSSCRAK